MAAADRATVRFDAGTRVKPSHLNDWVADMIEQAHNDWDGFAGDVAVAPVNAAAAGEDKS
jgi:hypothetical protein